MSTSSLNSISLVGPVVPGVHDRHVGIPGFSQAALSKARVLCIGAGGLMAFIAPPLVRKGVGAIKVLDRDFVETSNLNRQRFYADDIGQPKALAFAKNLQRESFSGTNITGVPMSFLEAVESGVDMTADVAICGVDNNPTRFDVARYYRSLGIPVIFCAVSADADHGYVFVQEPTGACLGCLFPDSVNDDRYPCPGTPAMADILQAVGALALYAIDALFMDRKCAWNYRTFRLSDSQLDSAYRVQKRPGCAFEQ